jgi:hypothetical protein
VFSAAKAILPETGSREPYKTVRFRELVVLFPCDESFRKGTKKINRVLWRDEEDAVQSRTLANMVEREGALIQEYIDKKAEDILKSHGFNAEGKLIDNNKGLSSISDDSSVSNDNCIAEDTVCKMIEELNIGKEKEIQIELGELHETFENPEKVKANISIDDVLSKKQKESGRKKGSEAKEKKQFVKNTVAHIQSGENDTYILNAASLKQMMTLVLAFLLNNGLLDRAGQLIFFIDGAADLRLAILHLFFGLLPFKIILDWYHVEKKCKERLSMAMKGKQVRKKVLEHILALLWRGKIDLAITYLKGLNEDDLKNPEEIKLLIGYFERNRSFIPCYALRQKLGLRVSSNPVEKANNLVVSDRQKHNGMSWSAYGSTGLATVTCVHQNSEQENWLLRRDIKFQFDADAEKSAA